MKISSFSELLDIVEQSRKKIWMWVTRFKIKVQNQTFFFWLIFSWVNIASVWSWTYRTAFHIHILDFYDNFWLRTECCYTFRLAKSLRIFLFRICLVLLYSNAMFQLTSHWPRLWFYSTSSTHRIHQIFSSQWTNASLGVSLFAFWLNFWQSPIPFWFPLRPVNYSLDCYIFFMALSQLPVSSWK